MLLSAFAEIKEENFARSLTHVFRDNTTLPDTFEFSCSVGSNLMYHESIVMSRIIVKVVHLILENFLLIREYFLAVAHEKLIETFKTNDLSFEII
jgi:hypothetical protein